MRRRWHVMLWAALVVGVMAVPAGASPPHSFEDPITFDFPDVENGLVVLINTDRATRCTDEQVAFEYAVIDWLEGGMVGAFPEQPEFAPGFEPVTVKLKETGQGAQNLLVNEDDLYWELWIADDDRPFVGPCTDTDGNASLLATGRGSIQWIDNDLFGSGTRGNAFGNRGTGHLTDGDGQSYTYSWRFHVNSRCYAPQDGPPACLLEENTLEVG